METKIPGITITDASANGTSLKGYVDATFARLAELLGPPNFEGDAYKVSTEWVVEYAGKTYTIYDYKETNLYDDHNAPSVEAFRARTTEYDWHIGAVGDAKEFIEALKAAL